MRTTSLEAINRFSVRWAAIVPPGGPSVFSAACAWPLLGLLAAAASGPVRHDLSDALGVRPESAHDLALDVLSGLAGLPGVGAALGLWSRQDLPLRPRWTDSLPPDVAGRLSGDTKADKERLDAWASRHTAGLIPEMPVQVRPETVLVLATALALETRWVDPFIDVPLTASIGPWAQRRAFAGLRRSTHDLDAVTVLDSAAGPITRLRLDGQNGIDVHLVLGAPDRPAAEILAAAMSSAALSSAALSSAAMSSAALSSAAASSAAGSSSCGDGVAGSSAGGSGVAGSSSDGGGGGVAGSLLPLGANAPGLTVEETLGRDPTPELAVQTARFTVRADHDLLSSPVFGLLSAREHGDHFPGISPDPLCVSEARQSAMAVFSSVGFEAAAVTAVAMTRAAYVALDQPRKTVRVTFDRPFGFYATLRDTGLILVAGWVTEPASG